MGRFVEGHEKLSGSGRKKGTPNRKTEALKEILDSKGLNLAEKIIELIPKLEPEKQADVILHLMGFIYPKKKAIDVVSDEPTTVEPLIVKFVDAK